MPWCPAGVKRVPFGDAVFTLLCPEVDRLFRDTSSPRTTTRTRIDDVPDRPRFGAWQPLFQPYFPEWRQNLEFPAAEPRDGYVRFSVCPMARSGGRSPCRPATRWTPCCTGFLRSFKFDRDHLCRFTYRNRTGATVRVNDPETGESPTTDEVQLGTLPLEPGQTMELLYDFGDHWEFTITLDRVEPPGTRIKAPSVLESRGKAPTQYPQWDE